MTKLYTLLLPFLFLVTACKTANKAYNRGDYHDAIELSIKKLQKDPHDNEAKAILRDAYRFAVEKHEDAVRIHSQSMADGRYEAIYREYVQLQNLYRKLREQPSTMAIVRPADYSSYIETYREKAADIYVQKGLTYMEEGEKSAFRNAYLSFKNALSIKPGDTGIRGKMVAAYDRAVVNVVVLPVDDFGSGRYGYGNAYGLRNFETELVRNLKYNTNNEFIKFYGEAEARQRDILPDELLELRLGRMEIGRPYDQSQAHTSSKNVVVKETVYKPDSVVKEYARITAQVTTTRRTLLSTGELYVTARNAKGTPLWNDVFRGEHRWQVTFATYRGDERALTDEDRALINKQPDRQAPREDEINEALLRQIESDLHSRIRQQYNRY